MVAFDGDTLCTSCYGLLTLITLSHILPQTDAHNELSSHTHTLFHTQITLWITIGFLTLTFSAESSLCAMCVCSLWRQCLKFTTVDICRSTEQFGMLLTLEMSLNVYFRHFGCICTWNIFTLRSWTLSKSVLSGLIWDIISFELS